MFISGEEVVKDSGQDESHPNSSEASARQTPQPNSHNKEIQATFAKKVAQAIINDSLQSEEMEQVNHDVHMEQVYYPAHNNRIEHIAQNSKLQVKVFAYLLQMNKRIVSNSNFDIYSIKRSKEKHRHTNIFY